MSPERDLDRLALLLAEAERVLAWPEERLYLRWEATSAWSPAQHVDHVARALDPMLRGVRLLEAGDDPRILPRGGPTLRGHVVLRTGWIPRGRGRAPDEVLPEPRPVRHRLRETLAGLVAQVGDLRPRAAALARARGWLPHPLLGSFDAAGWVRFAAVHTRHHLAIVADIDRHRAIGVPAAPRVAAAVADDEACRAGVQSG